MTATTTAIDLSAVLTPLLQLAGTILLGVATWAINLGAQKTGLENQTALKNMLIDATGRAITWAESQVGQKIGAGASIDVHNAVVAQAANYLLTKMPDTLKSLGISGTAIEDWVLAHLPPPVPAA